MNKLKRGLILVVILLNALTSNISAQQSQSSNFVDSINVVINAFIGIFNPISSAILGSSLGGQYLFAKVLFFILVLSVIWLALENISFFSNYEWAHWLVSIIVSILAVRFLGDTTWIQTILLPYSTLGVAITAGLPFVIYFIIVNINMANQSSIIRRIAWIFFAVIFVSLWAVRWEELMTLIDFRSTLFSAGNIYLWTALLSIFMAFFDGVIQRFVHKARLDRMRAGANRRLIDQLTRDLQQAAADLANGVINSGEYNQRVRDIRRRIISLRKNI